jgi:tagatose-1,6-bisphosphate aldolase non-catalytic subunit AgaZ/GatZ
MSPRPVRFALAFARLLAPPSFAWNNGQSGNANTDTSAECSNPPYATHDWVAEQALMLLPEAERDWLMPFKAVYLIGTEAPRRGVAQASPRILRTLSSHGHH